MSITRPHNYELSGFVDELHTQRFSSTALMIVWPKHGMCREIRLEQRPSAVGGCCSVRHRSPLGLEGSLRSSWECCPLQLCTIHPLQEPSHLKGAVSPQLRPLSLEWSISHNWSVQEWKDPNFLPQFGKRLQSSWGSAKALVETASQAPFSLCGLTLPSFPWTGADPQKLPN